MAAPGQDAQLHFWALEGSDARRPCPAPCTEPPHGSLPAPAAASRRKTEPCKTKTDPQEGAGLMQLHSPLQTVSPTPTASKGCTSVAVSLQETSLEVTLHSSVISQSPLYPFAPPQGLLCSSTCKILSEMVRHCSNSSSKSDPRWSISVRPPELFPQGWEYKVQLPICTTSIPFPATKELWPDCQSICHPPILSLVYVPPAQVFSN